ncbi:flagellar export protein FliJ [Cellulomonas sp. RIT-PI-Y]|jgi:flagellar protein FliJ|uniref:flagellar export protein FliJ n=1 Tax=Cellulomonas sp. RIT-PI-Y TaxID=3035297 RepID=UPI0021D9ADFA|nr:flagellar export protein FliJ [Cellulomonas sp. RIT-PI-Y]
MSAFRLAGLLRLRALAEEQAAVELAGATRARDAAVARRVATEEAIGAAAFPVGTNATALRAVIASRLALSGLLVEQRALTVAAQTVVDDKDAEWSAARTRTRTLEKLEERHVTTERDADQRAEQLVLDEIAGRRGGSRPTLPGEDA